MTTRLLVVVTLVSAGVAHAGPVITEIAWAGDPITPGSSGANEWIEIFNPDSQPIDDLSVFHIVGADTGAAALALPQVAVGDGDYFIVENTEGVPSSDPTHRFVDSGISLTNSGEILCLCAVTVTTCDASCDVVNPAVAAWFAGDSTSHVTMERKSVPSDGSLATSWQDGSPSSPLAASPVGGEGEGEGAEGEGAEGEGVAGEGEGTPVPDNAPTILVTEPSGSTSDAVVDVVYTAADPDAGDAVAVDLFWSSDGSGNNGVLFAQGLSGGSGKSASFDVAAANVPAGTVHIFARARDTRGKEAFAYAPGSITVGDGGGVSVSFEIKKPDGVNDVVEGKTVVTWQVTLPDGVQGTVALFDDTDDRGEDGVPIAGGLSAGADGPRAFAWDLTGVEPGEHFVYGVLTHTGGSVASYAPASITTAAPGCTCTESGPQPTRSLLAVATLAILAARFWQRRRCVTG